MLVAIIEFAVNEGCEAEVGELVSTLKPHLEAIDGFIAADPATSLNHDGLFYEISYWRDKDALAAWAADHAHQQAMTAGRERLLKWYRIRVAEVTRDWTVGEIPASYPPASAG